MHKRILSIKILKGQPTEQKEIFLNIPIYQIINYFKDPIKKNLSICTYICDFLKNQLPLIMHIKHEFSFD